MTMSEWIRSFMNRQTKAQIVEKHDEEEIAAKKSEAVLRDADEELRRLEDEIRVLEYKAHRWAR